MLKPATPRLSNTICYVALAIMCLIQADVERETGSRPSTEAVARDLANMVDHRLGANVYHFDYRTDLTDALCDAVGIRDRPLPQDHDQEPDERGDKPGEETKELARCTTGKVVCDKAVSPARVGRKTFCCCQSQVLRDIPTRNRLPVTELIYFTLCLIVLVALLRER